MKTCTDEQREKWIIWGNRIGAEFIMIRNGEPRFYRVMGEGIKRGLHWARSKGDKDNYIVEWVDGYERRSVEELAKWYQQFLNHKVQVIKL